MVKKKSSEWRSPGAATKAHYFPAGEATSACRRWMYTGPPDKEQSIGEHPGKYDCRVCWKAAKQEKVHDGS